MQGHRTTNSENIVKKCFENIIKFTEVSKNGTVGILKDCIETYESNHTCYS